MSISSFTQGLTVSSGFGFLEEGDDIFKPSIALSIEGDKLVVPFHYRQRTFGPVTQKTMLFGLARKISLSSIIKNFRMSLGGAFLIEKNSIYYNETLAEHNIMQDNFNLGFHFGLHYEFITTKPFRFTFNIDNSLFSAGLAGIFLVTARKQILSMMMSYDL